MGLTANDISRLANVSPATVSRVFSGNGYVKEETRKRVLEVASSVGYAPRSAVSLSNDPSHVKKVAMVIPNTSNDYYMKITNVIEEYLHPFGLSLLICCTNEDPENEYNYLCMIRDISVAGIIFVPSTDIEKRTVELVEMLDSSGVPVVLLDRDIRSTKMDGVFMDNYSSAYQSTKAFINEGHTRIAFIGSSPNSNADMDRMRGYADALRDSNLSVNKDYIVHGGYKFDTSFAVTKNLLSSHSEITAVFISISRITDGCLFALADMKLNYPEKISVICGGHPHVGADSISFIAYPTEEIGRECGKMLYTKLSSNGFDYRRRTFIDVQLILNGSEKKI